MEWIYHWILWTSLSSQGVSTYCTTVVVVDDEKCCYYDTHLVDSFFPTTTTTIHQSIISGPQGGAFERQDLDYERTVLGSNRMIPGLEQAMVGMTAGSVRQVLIPYGPLSYPPTRDGDGEHRQTGPTPTTFSGQRALNFVLDNPRIDRTLLFNVKVIRIDSPNARGSGFTRG